MMLMLRIFALPLVIVLTLLGTARAEPLAIATSKSGWLIAVAQGQGFFEAHDVDVNVDIVGSGVAAGDGLIAGKFDVATMSGFAFVTRSFNHTDLRLIGTIAAISNVRLVVRPDRGIAEPRDLSGKTIGLRGKSISEFFLGRMLDLHGVDSSSVKTVDIKPGKLVEKLSMGDVDGIVSWQPYAKLAADAVGAGAVEMTVQGGQSYYFDIVVTEATIAERRQDIVRMLTALVDAARWASENEANAQRIVSDRLGIDPEDVAFFWPDHVMDVALSQDMIFLMEEEAHWRIDHGHSAGNVPDFLDRIDYSMLFEVDPTLVTIVR